MDLLDYEALSEDYASYHRTSGNRRCHAFGVPLIAYPVIVWSRFGGPYPYAAVLLPVYFLWDVRVGLIMSSFIAGSAMLAARLPGWTAWAAFVAGVVLQYVGHAVFEKKRPAFARNLAHLLVGPAWVASKAWGLGAPDS